MITIAVDAMGGDDAPASVVEGAAQASLDTECEIALVGDEAEIERHLDRVKHRGDRIRIVGADGVIPMDCSPRQALAEHPDSSLEKAARIVAGTDGDLQADALVSAGNTGAVILACAEHFSRIPGIQRTALAAVVPTERRRGEKEDPFTLILDVGATVRVEGRDLVNFALMGAAYSRIISRNERPRVALLSNGSEANKGTREIKEAHQHLAARSDLGLNFVGNIEGVDIAHGAADVIVTDGFTDNVVLKMLEGVSETVMNIARFAYRSRVTWKLAMMLLSGGIRQLKRVTDWQQYGGAPILGFDRLCIKAHGRSSPRAIRNAIRVAKKCVEQDLATAIRGDLSISAGDDGPPA